MPRVRRRRPPLPLIVAVVVVFLIVSALLARIYSSVSAERAAVTALVEDEARGDQAAMLDVIYHCRSNPACRAGVAADATNLRRPGPVSVLDLTLSTSFPLGGTTGVTRIAWQPGRGLLPVTQCVRVRHTGNPISGLGVEVLAITPRIKTSADCPRGF
jgi:hypothetical protein